jgi:hypothetical protein
MIVHIISFNLLSPLPKLVDDCRRLDGVTGVTIIDNASTYPPLVEWLATCDCKVIRRAKNDGPMSTYRAVDRTDWYAITDCDLDIGEVPRDALANLRAVMERRPGIRKAGLSLEIDDLPATKMIQAVLDWESVFWQDRDSQEPAFWRADIATTFCVQRPGSGWNGYGPALRADRPYTARHLPWYWDPDALTDEQRHYLGQRFRGTWWSARLKRYAGIKSEEGTEEGTRK